jgi:uncharacterized protein DUF5317
MLWPFLALGIALLVPLVTNGSYRRLLDQPWRWGGFLVAGLGLQLALDLLPFPKARWHDVGYLLLVVSYVCLLCFCGRNLLMRGMSVVLVGVALNALAITVNQGMPVKVPADWQRDHRIAESIKHHPHEHGDHLIVITDIIVLRSPFNTVLSFGDLILAVGLCDVTYRASRRRRRRSPKPRPRPGPLPAPPELDVEVDVERQHVPIVDMRRISTASAAAPPPPVTPFAHVSAAPASELRELLELEELDRCDALGSSRYAGAFFDHACERVEDDRVVRVYRS